MGRNRKKNSVHYPYRLMMPALLVYSVFYMVPLLIGLVMSMTNWNIENLAFKGNFLNLDGLRFEGIKNYSSIFADRHFITALTNTVWFAMATTAAKLVLGLALAMALNARLKTKKYLRTIFYILQF